MGSNFGPFDGRILRGVVQGLVGRCQLPAGHGFEFRQIRMETQFEKLVVSISCSLAATATSGKCPPGREWKTCSNKNWFRLKNCPRTFGFGHKQKIQIKFSRLQTSLRLHQLKIIEQAGNNPISVIWEIEASSWEDAEEEVERRSNYKNWPKIESIGAFIHRN